MANLDVLDVGKEVCLQFILNYVANKSERQLEISNPTSDEWQKLDSEIDTIVEMITDVFGVDEFDVEMEIGKLAKEFYDEDHVEEVNE